jgi:GT2 family glycosyltransferase
VEYPSVDIVTINYNSGEHLPSFFEALRHLDYPGPWRLVLVDNASTDGSLAGVAAWRGCVPIDIVSLERNYGFAGGSNRGIQAGESDCVALLNPDTRVRPNWLSELVATMRLDDTIALVEARQEPTPLKKYYDPTTGNTSWGSGGGVLLRRQALRDVGLLDEIFFFGSEDVDLSWRFWLARWRCVFQPHAVYYHRPPEARTASPFVIYHAVRNELCLRFLHDSWRGFARYLLLVLRLPLQEKRPPYRLAILQALQFAVLALPQLGWGRWARRRLAHQRGTRSSPWVGDFSRVG